MPPPSHTSPSEDFVHPAARADRAGRRILIYSHDTLGLGHLRRCRALAHGLAARMEDLSVMILTGSPLVGSFDYRAGVDFMRMPGVVKRRDGSYSSLNRHADLDETVRLREAIIRRTADIFDPDLMIVDKEPLGFRGEMEQTLHLLRRRGRRLILGLRDVLDDPALLLPEWRRKNALDAVDRLYDEIWIYGLERIHRPLDGFDLPDSIRERIHYTGYLRRSVPQDHAPPGAVPPVPDGPYLLVTTGGGGDGEALVDWVLAAYESGIGNLLPAVIVFGPFMPTAMRRGFEARVERLQQVTSLVFHPRIEILESRAAGLVTMGGYNTFCEILALDKPAVIVPRMRPRREQFIRAQCAQELGLVTMVVDPEETGAGSRDPAVLAAALESLPSQPPPSAHHDGDLLNGLEMVHRRVLHHLGTTLAPSDSGLTP